MKRIFWMMCVLAAPLGVAVAGETAGFSERLTETDYKAAGLDKLTPEERVRLDALVAAEAQRLAKTDAGASANGDAANVAAKTGKPAAVPVIRGTIAGTLAGWKEGSVLVFEDGRRWQVISKGNYRAAPVRKGPKAELVPLANGNHLMMFDTVQRRVEVRLVTE